MNSSSSPIPLSRNQKWLVLVTLACFGVAYFFLFGFLRPIEFDSSSYIGAARHLFGLEGGFLDQSRITKPFVLIIPGLLEKITGIHCSWFFVIQNLICLLMCGILVLQIGLQMNASFRNAFYVMMIYVSCQPFAVYSLLVLTDITGWMFSLIMIYLVLKWNGNQSWKMLNLILLSCLAALGFLCKENALAGMVFAFFMIFFSKEKLSRKFILMLCLNVGFVLVAGLVSILVYVYSNDSEWNRLILQASRYNFLSGRTQHLEQLYHVLDVYNILFMIGVCQIVKVIFQKRETLNQHKIQLYYAAFCSLIFGLVALPFANYLLDRILFTLAPFALIFLYEIFDWFDNTLGILIGCGAILNIGSAFLIYKYNVQGLLPIGLVVFVMLSFAIGIRNRIFQKLTS